MTLDAALRKSLSDRRILNNHPELAKAVLELMAQKNDSATQTDLFKKLIMNYADVCRKLERSLEEVKQLSITDSLTQLYNRAHFNARLRDEMLRAKRYGNQFCVIMLDIDHFKLVNDNYGHDVGDMVLKKVSTIVRNTMRKSDVCARWGGEEFLLLAIEIEFGNACLLAERLRAAVAESNFAPVSRATASFGVSKFNVHENAEELLKRVDDNLYQAKHGGRNCVVTDIIN